MDLYLKAIKLLCKHAALAHTAEAGVKEKEPTWEAFLFTASTGKYI
jgi:hypothetical protein